MSGQLRLPADITTLFRAVISGVKTFPSGSRIHGYIICTHQTNATLFGRLNVRSAVPYPASVPLHVTNMVTNRPGCGPLQYGESRSLCKATILPAGGGAEESHDP